MSQTTASTVITTDPASSGDPRVYTDPYPGAKGSDLVKEVCGKCGGDGMYHAPSGYTIQNPYGPRGDAIKGCFDCRGVGHRWVKVSSVRARIRRAVKATLQRDADADAHAAAAAQRAAEEFAADWELAHVEQARRAALNNTPAGELAEKLTGVSGTVTVVSTCEVSSFRGYGTDIKRLIVVTLDSGQAIKAFGTGASLFAANRGDRVTISGTVKEFDTYRGQLQTVLTRAKLRIDAAAPSFDINVGDLIETGGDWYPVQRVAGDDVYITVSLGPRSWTSRIRRDAITAHRPG